MKVTCDVIKDLLPLYQDDVCSEDSRELIDEHIIMCEDCRTDLKAYKMEISELNYFNNKANLEEATALNSIAKKWKRDKRTSFLLGTTLVSIIASVFCMIAYNIEGSYVRDDGMLIEAFYYIPLAFLFGFIAVISLIVLTMMSIVKKYWNYAR